MVDTATSCNLLDGDQDCELLDSYLFDEYEHPDDCSQAQAEDYDMADEDDPNDDDDYEFTWVPFMTNTETIWSDFLKLFMFS